MTPPAVGKDEHVVKAGETLYGIAKLYKLEVMDLVRWNNLNLQEGIKPGQVIKLKESQPVANDREAPQKKCRNCACG